jgi:hypothetical protein
MVAGHSGGFPIRPPPIAERIRHQSPAGRVTNLNGDNTQAGEVSLTTFTAAGGRLIGADGAGWSATIIRSPPRVSP